MGAIEYGRTVLEMVIDDRALAHLQRVITTKLRRRESFLFNWVHEGPDGSSGRSSIWIDPAIPLQITYDAQSAGALNPRWLALLMETANATGNLSLLPEPEPDSGRRARR